MKPRILVTTCLIFITSLCFGQNTNFDLASFSPPKDWKKILKDGVVMYNSPENKKGEFCLISIYKAVDGSSDLSADFNNAWNELVAKRLSITDKPAIEKSEPENGWDSETGSAKFTLQGNNALAFLTTMSGYNKAMSILVITNTQSYLNDLDGFYKSVSMKKPDDNQTNQTSTQTVSSAGVMSDYIYTPPPGWSNEIGANEIVLKSADKKSIISIMPMAASSGDLEKDMNTIYWQVFAGWKVDQQNIDHHILTKGIAPSGWAYFKQELAMSSIINGKEMRMYGFVMLAQVNNQVAIIAGSFGETSSPLEESIHNDWQLFFHSLDFKNYKGTGDNALANDILGEWLTGGTSGIATYTFAANGHYSNGSAFRTSHEISSYQILEKTTSFVGDGTYTLKGNELTMIPSNNKKPETIKVRVFYRNEFGSWIKTIGLLQKAVTDGHLYELTMVIQEKK